MGQTNPYVTHHMGSTHDITDNSVVSAELSLDSYGTELKRRLERLTRDYLPDNNIAIRLVATNFSAA